MSAQLLTAGAAGAPKGQRVAHPDARSFLSTLEAGPRERKLALWVVLVSGLVFVSMAPLAKTPLPALPAFLPLYQSALIVTDLLTALLLFGQFAIVGSRGLLVLGGAYLFSAGMAVAHALSFPGLFAPAGLFGAGGQTTAWLYFLWHGLFPLAVIAYALLPDREGEAPGARRSIAPIAGCVALVLALVAGLYTCVVAGNDLLPVLMHGNRDAPTKVVIATASWMVSLVAIPVLWRRRQPTTVLDLWLMVVLWVWVFDIALASVLNAGRYDLGWYGGRVYGLLAGTFLLAVLLFEYTRLYAEVVAARQDEQRVSRASLARQAERLRIVHEIDSAIIAEVKPEAIAGAVLQPLRRLLGVARVNINLVDETTDDVEWFASAGRSRTHIGSGLRFPAHLIGDVTALGRGEPQKIDTRALPPGKEREALLATGVNYYMAVPMIAGGELIGAVSFGGDEDSFPEEQVTIALEVATQLAVAIGNARLYESVQRLNAGLEQRVRERTAALQVANRELESFSYSVSHDLRAPLRAIDGYGQMLEEDHAAKLDDEGRRLLGVVRESSRQMARLIDDLLAFSQVGRAPLARASVDMQALVREVIESVVPGESAARVEIGQRPGGDEVDRVVAERADGDRALLKQVWVNLVGNALKYSSKRGRPRIEIGGAIAGRERTYWVRDNGSGFDMRYYGKLFGVFQRLHRAEEFEGTGVGLAIVQRIVVRHGGRVWAEGAVDQGACFRFSLPAEGPQ